MPVVNCYIGVVIESLCNYVIKEEYIRKAGSYVQRDALSVRRNLQQQSQVGSFEPFSAATNWAVAQPVPASTVIASTGQLRAHAPHSMQARGLTSCAR